MLSFGPKSTWKLGDPPASRFKLIAGSVQNDAEVLQNLRWVKEPKPDTMIRWMRYQEPGQLRPPTLGWELAPMLILFKTSEQANAEWDWRGTPLKFSLYGGNAYTPMESTDGWMEKLVTELANGGESEGAAQYDPITIQPLA